MPFAKVAKKKSIIMALTILLIVTGVVGYFVFNKDVQEAAAWFNDDWGYRVLIPITNSGSTQTDFWTPITINTQTLASAGKIQTDCDDARFADTQGNVLPYWFSGCNTTTTKFWVKIPSIPTTGINIYFYYGNTIASAGKTAIGNEQNPALSCKSIYDSDSSAVSNFYWVDFTNGNTSDKQQVYCDMANDSGGWMLVKPSMIDSETMSAATTVQTTDINGGLILNATSTGLSGCSESHWQKMLLKDDIPWTKIKADYEFTGTFSCWGIFGNSAQNSNSNLISFASGTDTIRNQVRMGGSAGDNFDGITSRCDNETVNFWHSLNGATARTAQVILRRNSMASLAGLAMGGNCTGNPPDGKWKYQNIFIREDNITYSYLSIGSLGSEEKGGGPIAYWRFDEGQSTTTLDSTTNNNTITTSSTSWLSEDKCISSKCLQFNGSNSYASALDTNILDINSTQMTIGIWVNPKSFSTTPTLVHKESGGAPMGGYHLFLDTNGRVNFRVRDSSNNNQTAVSTNSIPLNQWSYVTGVYNGSNVIVYINGKQDGSQPAFSAIIGSTNIGLFIGAPSSLTGYFLNGFLDDAKIYNYARSTNQILTDYNSAKAGAGSAEGANVVMGAKSQKWLSDKLAIYYKMDEASWNGTAGEVIDSSGNGLNGVAAGGLTTTMGKFGRGPTFDGSDDAVTLPSTKTLGNGNWTVSAWVKTSADGSIMSNNSGGPVTNNMQISAGKITYASYNGSWVSNYGTSTITNGVWHFLTWVNFSNQTMNLYVDGIVENSGFSSTTNNGGPVNSIGRNWAASMNGSIDEVRIYDRALSGSEVVDLYNWAPGPIGYWKLDDNTGTTAVDASGNGNNGTLMNSPTWTVGKYGPAVRLSTNDKYINVPTLAPNITNKAFTIQGWVNLSLSGIQRFFAAAADYPQVGFNGSNLYIHTTTSAGTDVNLPSTVLPTNCQSGWHNIAITWDTTLTSNNVKAYCDGANFTNATLVNSIGGSFNISGLKIGYASGTQSVNGAVDDIKIYNYARTSKQIKEDMNTGIGSPVAYWNFDEPIWNGTSAEVKDLTGNGHNGTAQGGLTTAVAKYGRAGNYLDAGDYINTTGNISTSDGISISAWIYPTDRNYRTIARIGNQAVTSFHWLYLMNSNITWQYANGTNYIAKTTSYTMSLNQWSHLLVVHDYINKSIKFYVNGKLIGTQTHTDSVSPITDKLVTLGAYAANDGVFAGLLDEVKIYNYVLNDNDVAQDYNQSSAVALGTGTEAGDTGNAPVAWWKMDELTGTTTADASGNGKTGTLEAGPTWTVGKNGSAVKFDGNNDQITSAFNGINVGTSSFSISTWIKLGSMPTINPRIVAFAQDANNGYSLVAYGGSSLNIFMWEVKKAGSFYGTSQSGSQFVANQWYHLEGTFDNATNSAKLYVNGILQSGGGGNLSIPPTTGTLYIGSKSSDSFFQGAIDDVKIYEYVRSQAQVAYDYNRGAPMGYWPFDEGDGLVARDISGSGNSGSLISGPVWSTSKYGNGLYFDGVNDYVSVNSSAYRFSSGDFTASVWVSASVLDATYDGLLTTDIAGDSAWKITRQQGNNFFDARYNGTTLSFPAVNINEWHAYTMTKSGTTLSIYMDGKFITSGTCPSTHSVVSNSLVLGSYRINDAATGTHMFNGKMDDIRIYNYALTADQVKQAVLEGAAVRF